MNRIKSLAAALALLAWTTPGTAEDKALLFTLPIGAIPDAVSAGGTVVGSLQTGGSFYWMPTTGVVYTGGKAAVSLSRDGRTIIGTAYDSRNVSQAGIWQRAAEWQLLGSVVPNAAPCDDLLSASYDTSDDGRVIVGLAWNGCNFARAFRWEAATGMVDLGSTVAGRSSRANGISGNAEVIVGWQEAATGFRQGAKWVGGRQELFAGPLGVVGEAFATNVDGSMAVGQVCRPGDFLDQSGWIWTASGGGILECLPPPRLRLGNFLAEPLAMNDDGRVIGGGHSFGLESEALIWIDRSPMYLKDYLRANGVPNAFEGWVNTGFVQGISPDGRILVGGGAGPRDFQGYVVILPPLGDRQ